MCLIVCVTKNRSRRY